MKALTIHQPYAELIASGTKRVENRSTRTHYRGPIAIHAGLRRNKFPHTLMDAEPPGVVTLYGADKLDFGAVIAVAELVECIHLADVLEKRLIEHPLAWVADHPYAFGPWCWVLADVRRLKKPIPCKGNQLIWNLPDDIARKVKRATPRT